MRSLLYDLLGISEKEMDKWMMEKAWGAVIIDIIIMFMGGIIVGVVIMKILSKYRISPDSKYIKYIIIIILNLVVFGLYYILHANLIDEYMGEIFDRIFEEEGDRGEVAVFTEDAEKEAKRDVAKKMLKTKIEKPGWWRGFTIFMGGNELVSV